MSRSMRLASALASLIMSACSEEKQLESDRRYMSTAYADTVYETFGRTDRTITGMLIEKTSDTVRFRIHTKGDGLVSKVDLTLHPNARRGQTPVTQIVSMPTKTLPLMMNSVAFLEQLLRRAMAVGGDSVSIPVMLLGARPETEVFTVVRNGADSLLLMGPDMNPDHAMHLAIDQQDRIVGGILPLSGTRIVRSDSTN